MFKTLNGAVERIAFQLNSSLAKGVVALCQDTLDQVTALGKEGKALSPKVVQREMKNFREFRKKLTKILEAETAITVRNVDVVPFGCINAYMVPSFHTSTNIKDTHIWQSMFRMQGLTKVQSGGYQTILDQLASGTDLKTGKVSKAMKDVYRIDIGLATELFTSAHNYSAGVGFSAAEIAAIILHEVGHGITFAENLGNAFYRATEARDSFALLTENGTPEAQANLIKGVTATVKSIKDNDRRKGYLELLDAAMTHDDANRQAVTAAHVGLDILIGRTIGTIISAAFIPGSIVYGAMGGILRAQVDAATVMYYCASTDVKTSDTVISPRNMSVTERIADEYVSRHGLGRYLNSALTKLTISEISKKSVGPVALRFLSGVGIGIADMVSTMFPSPTDVPYTTPYDDLQKRMDLIVQNNMSAFKDPNIPPQIRDRWIRETEVLLKDTEVMWKMRWPDKVRHRIWNTLLRMNTVSTLTGTFMNANLQADYAKLQDWSRGLIRNQLYFRAAQVKQLIGRKT